MQLPLPVEVKVSVILPLVISAGVGVYVAFSVVADGLKLPSPPVQTPPEATVIDPASVTTALLAHFV
jgi:hypothetical protein